MPPVGSVVLGLQDVKRRLDLLGKSGQPIVRKALYQGAVPIRDEARRLAPAENVPGGGSLKKGIRASTGRRKIGGDLAAYVLVASAGKAKGAKAKKAAGGEILKQKNPRKYAHLVEYGTAPHLVGKGGKGGPMHPGARPHPFMRPAFDAKKETAVRVISENIRENVNAVWEGRPASKITEADLATGGGE